MFKRASPALDSVGFCSIASFAREKLDFDMCD